MLARWMEQRESLTGVHLAARTRICFDYNKAAIGDSITDY